MWLWWLEGSFQGQSSPLVLPPLFLFDGGLLCLGPDPGRLGRDGTRCCMTCLVVVVVVVVLLVVGMAVVGHNSVEGFSHHGGRFQTGMWWFGGRSCRRRG